MDTIENLLKELTGRQVIPLPAQTSIWKEWLAGNVTAFHHYEVYNGQAKVKCVRRTLNMGKKIPEDWANLLWNEKISVVYGNDAQQEQLDEILKTVNFWQKGNQGIELTFALGNGAFVEGFDEHNNPRLQFVNATKIYPLNIEQDKITECAFVNSGALQTVIQIHARGKVLTDGTKKVLEPDENGNYAIRTLIYNRKTPDESVLGEKVFDDWFDTRGTQAWFQMLKPNIANNIDINSPMGISVYANAIDNMEGVDLAYDGFCEEMRLGKARIFLDKRIVHIDEQGEHYLFDVNDTGFYWLGGGEGANQTKPIEFYAPPLRTDSYFAGINNALNLLSAKTGFGENHYKFDQSGLATATQVISQNSEMFRTIRKHEIVLNDVIVDMCRVLMYINNEFLTGTQKFNLDESIEVKFDDSIIEDKATEMLNDRQDVASGIMSRAEYRAKWYNEDEATAKAKIDEIDAEKQTFFTDTFSQEE